MPTIYYCNGLANNDLGILRAVLSWEECRSLLKLFSVQYAGLQFPTMTQQDQGLAVLNLRCVSKPSTRSKTRGLT